MISTRPRKVHKGPLFGAWVSVKRVYIWMQLLEPMYGEDRIGETQFCCLRKSQVSKLCQTLTNATGRLIPEYRLPLNPVNLSAVNFILP